MKTKNNFYELFATDEEHDLSYISLLFDKGEIEIAGTPEDLYNLPKSILCIGEKFREQLVNTFGQETVLYVKKNPESMNTAYRPFNEKDYYSATYIASLVNDMPSQDDVEALLKM